MQKTFNNATLTTDFLGEIRKNSAIDYIKANVHLLLDNQLNRTEIDKFERFISLYPECKQLYVKFLNSKKVLSQKIPMKFLDKKELSNLNLELKDIYLNVTGDGTKKSRLPDFLKKILIAFNLY